MQVCERLFDHREVGHAMDHLEQMALVTADCRRLAIAEWLEVEGADQFR